MENVPNWAIAAFLQPFALMFLAIFVFWPVKALIRRYMTDGKLKRLLLKPMGSPTSR